jgi:hypothetical protein
VGAHVFGVSHPSFGLRVAEHVRKGRHPLLVLVAGEVAQCRNRTNIATCSSLFRETATGNTFPE